MPLCHSHAMKGEAPRFLQYRTCDLCEDARVYRKLAGSKRKEAETRRHRGMGRVVRAGQTKRQPAWHWPSYDRMLAQEEFWAKIRGLPLARDARHGA